VSLFVFLSLVVALCVRGREAAVGESANVAVEAGARGDHWAKIVEHRAIKNRVQYVHCR
jgi:hypothetical protein